MLLAGRHLATHIAVCTLRRFHHCNPADPFGGVLVGFAIYAALERKWRLYAVFVVLSLMVKEDASLVLVPLGIWVTLKRDRRIGLLTVFSFNIWAHVRPLGMFEVFAGMTFYGLIDYFTANLLMPLGGIFIAVFVGWRLKKEHLDNELIFPSPAVAQTWLFLIRFAAPLAILLVLVTSLR